MRWSPTTLVQSRFLDTALGAAVGLVGGLLLYRPRPRALVHDWLWALVPARMKRRH